MLFGKHGRHGHIHHFTVLKGVPQTRRPMAAVITSGGVLRYLIKGV